jgi:large-conductance mechanosensitive channel
VLGTISHVWTYLGHKYLYDMSRTRVIKFTYFIEEKVDFMFVLLKVFFGENRYYPLKKKQFCQKNKQTNKKHQEITYKIAGKEIVMSLSL